MNLRLRTGVSSSRTTRTSPTAKGVSPNLGRPQPQSVDGATAEFSAMAFVPNFGDTHPATAEFSAVAFVPGPKRLPQFEEVTLHRGPTGATIADADRRQHPARPDRRGGVVPLLVLAGFGAHRRHAGGARGPSQVPPARQATGTRLFVTLEGPRRSRRGAPAEACRQAGPDRRRRRGRPAGSIRGTTGPAQTGAARLGGGIGLIRFPVAQPVSDPRPPNLRRCAPIGKLAFPGGSPDFRATLTP